MNSKETKNFVLFYFKTNFTLVESMIFQDVTEAVNRNGNTGNRKRNAAGQFDFLRNSPGDRSIKYSHP